MTLFLVSQKILKSCKNVSVIDIHRSKNAFDQNECPLKFVFKHVSMYHSKGDQKQKFLWPGLFAS